MVRDTAQIHHTLAVVAWVELLLAHVLQQAEDGLFVPVHLPHIDYVQDADRPRTGSRLSNTGIVGVTTRSLESRRRGHH